MVAAGSRILVTGANGHLGRQLIVALAEAGRAQPQTAPRVRALVRSQRAADSLSDLPEWARPEIVVCSYTDAAGLEKAATGCHAAVHLVGIIKEAAGTSYRAAHEDSCEALAAAAARAGLGRIVYLSIVGSRSDSSNACLASKGRAEQILLAGEAPACVLRVPMVLGPADFASWSLRKQARSSMVTLVRGGATIQQPIDSRDVIAAVCAALDLGSDDRLCLDLGGPEQLSQRALLARAAALHGTQPTVIPVPLLLARAFAWLFERLSASPPITRAMLGVLQHDDRVDTTQACDRLGLSLTPLDTTLARYVGPEASTP
jgi:NADH dehydrogenase